MKTFAAALASSALILTLGGYVCAWQTITDPMVSDPQSATSPTQGLKDYMNASGEPIAVPQLGILVTDDSTKLNNFGSVSGAGVAEVSAKGASDGVLEDHHTSHMIVNGALLGAGAAAVVMFPPAVIAVVVLARYRTSGESLDLIIAVDGNRVRNTVDLIEAVQDARKGDAVYLTIVRKGERRQMVVHVQ